MNEILINIISVVVTAVVLPLLSLVGTRLVKFINTKITNVENAKKLSDATTIVLNAVRSVFQTYVESLKKSGSFDASAQRLALEKAKNIAIYQISEEVKNYITENFGDLDNWLITQIEATINTLKNK